MDNNTEIDPYKIIKGRYESNVDRFILNDLFISNNNINKELIEDIKNNKIVIYTAITGEYDGLKEPDFIDDNCDYVCFTDNPNLNSDTWKIVQIDESTLDNNRKAKEFKVLPHKYFSDYKYSLWIDGSFKIKGSIREYIYKYATSSMVCVVHPERDCIYDEAESSIQFQKYSNFLINKQVNYYKDNGMPKHFGLSSLGVIFREHNNSEIINLMNQWWDEIINFTNQDQLSFSYLMWKNNFKVSCADIYIWFNEYWGKDGNYHHTKEETSYLSSKNLIKSLENNIKEKNTLTKEELLFLFNDIDGLKEDAYIYNNIRNNIERQLNDITSSTSWKITKPLRKLRKSK